MTQTRFTFFHFQQLFLPTVKPTLHFLLAVLQCTKPYSCIYFEIIFTFQTWYCSFAAVAEAFLPHYFRRIIAGERLFPPYKHGKPWISCPGEAEGRSRLATAQLPQG